MNYDNSLKCKVCKREIQDTAYPNYFQLWAKGTNRFITFHNRCAFKKGTTDQFNKIAGEFDYRFDVNLPFLR